MLIFIADIPEPATHRSHEVSTQSDHRISAKESHELPAKRQKLNDDDRQRLGNEQRGSHGISKDNVNKIDTVQKDNSLEQAGEDFTPEDVPLAENNKNNRVSKGKTFLQESTSEKDIEYINDVNSDVSNDLKETINTPKKSSSEQSSAMFVDYSTKNIADNSDEFADVIEEHKQSVIKFFTEDQKRQDLNVVSMYFQLHKNR